MPGVGFTRPAGSGSPRLGKRGRTGRSPPGAGDLRPWVPGPGPGRGGRYVRRTAQRGRGDPAIPMPGRAGRIMVEFKTPGEIESIRAAGRIVADVLATVRAEAAVGVRLADLDEVARAVLKQAGA